MKNLFNLSIDQTLNQSSLQYLSHPISKSKMNHIRPLSSLYNSMTRASTGKYNHLNTPNSSFVNILLQSPIKSVILSSSSSSLLHKISSTKLIDKNAINIIDRKNIRKSNNAFKQRSKIYEILKSKQQSCQKLHTNLSIKHFKRYNLWDTLNKNKTKNQSVIISNQPIDQHKDKDNYFNYEIAYKKKKKAEQNDYIKKSRSGNIDLNAAKKLFKFEHILHSHKENVNQILKDQVKRKKGCFREPFLKKFISTKEGYKSKVLKMSTIAIRENVPRKNFIQRQLENNDGRKGLNKAVRLQCIAWLWMFKKVLIQRLLLCYKQFKWFLDKKKTITLKVFEEFMIMTEIEKDDVFIKNIFLIFDPIKSGSIDFQEVIINFIMFNDSTYESNISFLLGLLIKEELSKISLWDFINLIRSVLSLKEMKKVVEILKSNFYYNEHDEIYVSYKELYSFLNNNEIMMFILKSKMISYIQLFFNCEQEMANTSLMNMRNSQNCLMNHETKIFIQSEYKQLANILKGIQCCKESRKNAKNRINSDNDCNSSEEPSFFV